MLEIKVSENLLVRNTRHNEEENIARPAYNGTYYRLDRPKNLPKWKGIQSDCCEYDKWLLEYRLSLGQRRE